jgi:DDE family transposase
VSEKKGGRKTASEAQPGLLPAAEAAIAQDTAGSPVDENIRWTNRSVPDLAAQLQEQGFEIGVDALRRILFDELGLSRRAAFKDEAACHFPQRDEQFEYIARLRARYERKGWPILSIDTKKKEILGNFFHPGRALTDGRVIVQDHDFVTASQRLVPYGVFDVQRNEGLMLLATGSDTCELACDAIRCWWRRWGRRHYWFAPQMLVLSDCGGSNGNRQQRFKEELCYLASDLKWTCNWLTIHPAAPSTIRSSTACSATSRARCRPWCSRLSKSRANSSPARPRPSASASSRKSPAAPMKKDSKPPDNSSTTTPSNSTPSCRPSITLPPGWPYHDPNREVISR